MNCLKKIIIAVLPLMVLSTVTAQASTKRYDIKSGYIKYESNNGTEELFWDSYGEKEARYTDHSVTVFGMTQASRNVDYIDGEWSYHYDPATNIATRYNQAELMQRMTGNKSQQPKDFSEEMIKSFGGVKIGSENVLNKNTDIYHLKNFGDFKVWVYKGVPLKSEVNMMGMSFTSKAVEFKENTRVDLAKLTLPAGAQIVEGDVEDMPTSEELQAARGQMLEMQNDPEVQEAMKQMQELQNDPEFMDAMKQMQELQNNPQYNDALQKTQNAQKYKKSASLPADSEDISDRAGSIIKEETDAAVEDAIRDTTRDGLKKALGGGLKSIFNN
ncbi:MAG: hypothetical protein AB7S78_09700 [Candidatus Omnitrophota bacterium]